MSLAAVATEREMNASLPFYQQQGHECALFEAAFRRRLPILLKGPTGCGKTRFVAYMAAKLGLALDTIACHDDLTAADLTGRYLIKNNETIWTDGPLTRAVRRGGICYLDEVVEARKDVTVVLHPLTDDRRILPLDRTGETLHAPDDFMLVISYNPGYQSVLKTLKPSTRQRFVAIAFDYPRPDVEASILSRETGLDLEQCKTLVRLAGRLRALKGQDLEEGASTRLLVACASLITDGMKRDLAIEAALIEPLSDDPDVKAGLLDLVKVTLG
ncbi:AAA family ATPase [Rhodoblastus sp. 17X3]|uniref:AAA family ATPase n=1 Tax=Rhodoblastus sp. 17X3 TaxID=3047026 RepID=UPI00406C0AFB